MTAEQFVWWLRGYLDSFSELTNLPRADVQALRDRLGSVGPVPYTPPPAPPSALNPGTLVNPGRAAMTCQRCGQVTSLGAHFCNGALVP